jgi:zinc protease
MLALFDKVAGEMTPTRIEAAMKELFEGAGPRMLLLSPQPVEGGNATVAAALAAAEKAAPAVRQAERTVTFDDLPRLGAPGRVVSRKRIADMDVTIVRFANGSTLTFKPTKFEKGSVLVEMRFGNGLAGLPRSRPTVAWSNSVVVPSGLADLDLDGLERLTTGRRMNISFGIDEDALVLTGATSAEDLPDQLRLLTSKLAFPRWDAALFNRFKTSWLDNFELNFASASARGRRELDAVLHPGDERWVPVDKAAIDATTPTDVERLFAPLLAAGPVDAIIVGDVSLGRAVAAAARTIGALPVRSPPPASATTVSPPQPSARPQVFTHNGSPDQAFALIGWSTLGGTQNIASRRALAVAASVLQVRLFDRMREDEGATYAPSATAIGSDEFPQWGVFFAAAEIRPENADKFYRIARELVADLAAKPVAADEFARAQNPIVSGIERRIKSNGYWLDALENWTSKPELIEQTRRYLSDYREMTAEKVRAAMAAFVADQGDWSMLVVPGRSKADGD